MSKDKTTDIIERSEKMSRDWLWAGLEEDFKRRHPDIDFKNEKDLDEELLENNKLSDI